ncbi:MAG: branched-chain amino acid ABC transporter permease [Jatrophihabitantaceae bacterium]
MAAVLAWMKGSTLLRHLVLLVLGVVLVIVLTDQLQEYQFIHLGILGAYICAAAGLTVLVGLNGQISLGHAALMAIGAYTVALIQNHFTDQNVTGLWVLPICLLAGAFVTAVAGAVIGVAAARLRGPYLAGATLTLGVALPPITSHFTSLFNGDQGLSASIQSPPTSLGYNFSFQHWQAWIGLFCALVVLFFLANLNRSAVGRHMRAVRDDEIAAALCGLSVPRIQITTFAVSSATAGLGGGVLAVMLGARPGAFDLVLSLTLLLAVVIGGLGSLTGAVIGSVIVVYLATFITDRVSGLGLSASSTQNLTNNLPSAVFGLLLIIVMLALPGGAQGLLRRLLALIPRRTTQPTGGQK